ncbi:ABC transporter permease [soil metagenome]
MTVEALQSNLPVPLVKIRASSRWQAINFREIWAFRDLIRTLAGRDIKLRYRQTALGIVWVILQPLLGAGIFAFVSSVIAKTPTDGQPVYPFVFVGMIAWTAASTTLTKSSTCLIQNTNLVSKVYFPRLILPISTVFSTLVDISVSVGMLAVLLALYKISPSSHLWLMPVWLACLLALALGFGLIASALTVQYRDVQFVLPVAIQFLLFITPIWFPRSAFPAKYQWVYTINPLSGLIDAFRWSILPGIPIQWSSVVYAVVFSGAALLFGAYSFRSMERRFADVI